jgi:hypothetical protein
MKSKIYTLLIFSFLASFINAQSFLEISTGSGYNSQQFIRLQNDKLTSVKLSEWDIAFTSFGTQDAGIHINEAAGIAAGPPPAEIEAYDTKSSDFSKIFVFDSIKANRLYNDEKSWSYGAINSSRSAMDPFDYGWGKYVPSAQKVSGSRVFVLKLKSGKLIKFMISDLTGLTYNFKYANLDGSSEVIKSINKSPGSQNLLFYSFEKESFVNIAPTDGYDLIYTRYTSLAQDPNSPATAQYNVTGILTAPGATTAVVISQNPVAEVATLSTIFTKQTDLIGYDWKNFVNNQWVLNLNKVCFIKSAINNHIYKIRFIDFAGAATGSATIEKTDLGILSSSEDIIDVSVGTYPNPVVNEINVIIDTKNIKYTSANISMLDMSGKEILNNNMILSQGLNANSYDVSQLNAGTYILNITSKGKRITSQLITKI